MNFDRDSHLERLRVADLDLLVIGGGATGTGVALDAAQRGLSVGLVEAHDFSAGTSSRSTKLIHGGVRYLEQAVKGFDRSQFRLVRDALRERAILLRIAPHLTQPIPLVTPLYNWLEVPYYLTGLKLYDWLAGKEGLSPSAFIDAEQARQRFPMLKGEGLRGGVVYYDGQFDDARMNVTLALTAAQHGAMVANHVAVEGLELAKGKRASVELVDGSSGERWEVTPRVVVNAAGPQVDEVRRLADPKAADLLSVSSGAHIVLGEQFSPPGTGLLIPETEDGRVLFLLPWLGRTLAGTTDNRVESGATPRASEDEIEYILRHIRRYFALPAQRSDVLASWAGVRPLVTDRAGGTTSRISRDHLVEVADNGLVSVAGGKWTTYRKMAADAVDVVQKLAGVTPPIPSRTSATVLYGGAGFRTSGAGELQERYGLEADVASHLNRSYGDRAVRVAELAAEGLSTRLSEHFPYLEAEVVYAAREEMARSSIDVLSRRTRLGFLDRDAAVAALPRVSDLLSQTLSWSQEEALRDRADAASQLI